MTTDDDHKDHFRVNPAVITPAPVDDKTRGGFYFALKKAAGEEVAQELWKTASVALSERFEENDPDVIRRFLLSRQGRFLALSAMSHTWPECYRHVHEMVNSLMDTLEECDTSGNQTVSAWAKAFQAIKNGEDY
ncbi:MAG: hypothetical protein FWH27_06210 [Planctomycetaceae bacterium]|nr:hypothetical protein [Planctomycetaceae bacterium]